MPALPASARGYEDKRLQRNYPPLKKGRPQHSLTPRVPTSPPSSAPFFHSRQHKVTSANAFSILMQASRRRIIKSKNLKWERGMGKTYLGLPTHSSSRGVSLFLTLTPSPCFSFRFNPSSALTNCTACFFSCLDAAEGGLICCLLQSIKFPQTDLS